MCGVPIHAAEAYLARLIRAGHRVAIAEQIESPAEAKKRGAKSVVEPGDRPRRHGGHADRGGLARFARRQLAGRGGEGRRALRPRRRRHLDRPVRAGLDPARRARRRAGAAGRGRDRSRPSRWTAPGSGAARASTVDRGRAAAEGEVRGRHARRLRPVRPGRAVRRRRPARLSRRGRRGSRCPSCGRRCRSRGRPYDDRRGDARKPGADRLRHRHARRQPARRGRPHA